MLGIGFDIANAIFRVSGGGAPAGLTAPVLSRSSSAGAAPLTLDAALDSTIYAGFILRLQIDNNSDFSSPEQDITQIIDAASWAAGDMTLAGFTTPSGLYYARCRVETAPGDPAHNTVSGWSNTITDTIVSASTVLNSVTGTNKSSFVTVSGSPALAAIGTNGVGAACMVRANQTCTHKGQWEVTLTSAVSATIYIVVDDGSTNYNGGFVAPGQSNSLGVCLGISSSTVWSINRASTQLQSGSNTFASGTIISIVQDPTNGTLSFYVTNSGVTTQLGTTVSGNSSTFNTASIGFNTNNSASCNFGQSAFARTLGGGGNGLWLSDFSLPCWRYLVRQP
jgi:hypothetical protein